ncbi:MAG TPA: hypothetical protein VME18_11735 [Acidobacteriaceae bacterium]|nr:hypothetical protein [Acidobacteriaceae bacterium]
MNERQVWKDARPQLSGRLMVYCLPEGFARRFSAGWLRQGPSRMARQEREPQMLASLNHPKGATICGIGKSGATRVPC